MSSSTSGSKGLARILVTAAAAVLVCEGVVRYIGDNLSLNIRHIKSIPAIAAELAGGPRPRILFLGASQVRRGIDLEAWKTGLAAAGVVPGTAREAVPDDSWVSEWYYIVLDQFVRRRNMPDLVIAGFSSPSEVCDRKVRGGRIGAFYGDLRNIPELFSRDLRGLAERADFLLGHSLLIYGFRDVLQKRVGDYFIPGYRKGARQVNSWARSAPAGQEAGAAAGGAARTFRYLSRFAKLLRDNAAGLVLVMLPTPTRRDLDPGIGAALAAGGAALIDGRSIPGLAADDFLDNVHLNERGARKFTAWLVPRAAWLVEEAGR